MWYIHYQKLSEDLERWHTPPCGLQGRGAIDVSREKGKGG